MTKVTDRSLARASGTHNLQRLEDPAAIGNEALADEPQTAFQELDRLRALPPNWDSYGAPAPDPSAVDAAWQFLQRLLVEAGDKGVKLPTPSIQASAAGTVGFAWGDPRRTWTLEVEAHPDGVVSFVRSEDDRVEAGTVETAAVILEMLRT